MNRHPGGEEQTLHLLEPIELRRGMKALDLGAGEGETVRLLRSFGLNACGVDLFPRSSDVQEGDFLNLKYALESIDLCISQCAFFVSRDQPKAIAECWRVLKKGGYLLLIRGILWKLWNVQVLPFYRRKTRRHSGESIIWKHSGGIHSAVRTISFCRKNIKEKR